MTNTKDAIIARASERKVINCQDLKKRHINKCVCIHTRFFIRTLDSRFSLLFLIFPYIFSLRFFLF